MKCKLFLLLILFYMSGTVLTYIEVKIKLRVNVNNEWKKYKIEKVRLSKTAYKSPVYGLEFKGIERTHSSYSAFTKYMKQDANDPSTFILPFIDIKEFMPFSDSKLFSKVYLEFSLFPMLEIDDPPRFLIYFELGKGTGLRQKIYDSIKDLPNKYRTQIGLTALELESLTHTVYFLEEMKINFEKNPDLTVEELQKEYDETHQLTEHSLRSWQLEELILNRNKYERENYYQAQRNYAQKLFYISSDKIKQKVKFHFNTIFHDLDYLQSEKKKKAEMKYYFDKYKNAEILKKEDFDLLSDVLPEEAVDYVKNLYKEGNYEKIKTYLRMYIPKDVEPDS